MNAIVVRLERLNNRELNHQRKHDLRTSDKELNYVDSTRTHLNSILIRPIEDKEKLLAVVNQRRVRKRKLKKDAVLLWHGVVGFGHKAQEKIEKLSPEQQNELFYSVVKRIADFLATDIESLVVHRDESAVHCHFTLFNHTKDNTTLSQKVKPQVLSQIQDIASQVMKEMGLDIERGKKKFHRLQDKEYHKVIHKTVRQLHRDLPFEYAKLKKVIKNKTEELASLEQKLKELRETELELSEKIKTHEERIQKLQEKISQYEKEHQDYQDKISQAKKTLQVYENRKTKTEKELEEIQSQILQEEKRLQAILKDITEYDYQTKYELIREKYYSLVRTIKELGDEYPKLKELFISANPEFKTIFPETIKLKEYDNKNKSNSKNSKSQPRQPGQ